MWLQIFEPKTYIIPLDVPRGPIIFPQTLQMKNLALVWFDHLQLVHHIIKESSLLPSTPVHRQKSLEQNHSRGIFRTEPIVAMTIHHTHKPPFHGAVGACVVQNCAFSLFI